MSRTLRSASWYVPAAAVAILVAVASFLPDRRLWGVNHLAYYAPGVRALGLVVIALSFLPTVRRAVARGVSFAVSSLRSRCVWRIASVLVPVAAVGLFLAFPTATHLLGDSHLIESSVVEVAETGMPLSTFVEQMDWAHPGAELLNYGAARLAARGFSANPLAGVKTLSAVFGALFVWTLVWALRRSVLRAEESAPVVLLALFSGGIQIFFGYVEVYAPVVALAVLYIVAAKRSLAGNSGVWFPLVCAVAAVFVHLMAVFCLPSLGYLLLAKSRAEASPASRRIVLVASVLLTVLALFAASAFSDARKVFLPPVGRSGGFGAFSPVHLLDVVNETWLLFPAFGVLLLGRRVGAQADASSPAGSSGSARPETRAFDILVAVPALAALVLVDPKLGMARDWDLFAVCGVGLYTLGAALAPRSSVRQDADGGLDERWVPLLVTTLVLASSWVGVNADRQRSVERYESILAYDRTNTAYAYESLAAFYKENGEVDREIEALEKAVAASPNPRYFFVLGTRYYHVGETEKAISSLRRALERKPDYDRARRYLVQMLYYADRLDELFVVCEQGEVLSPDEGFYPYFAGKAYLKRGDTERAVAAFAEARKRHLSPDEAEDVDRILRALGRE